MMPNATIGNPTMAPIPVRQSTKPPEIIVRAERKAIGSALMYGTRRTVFSSEADGEDFGFSSNRSPQCLHLIASARMSSAQYGHFFVGVCEGMGLGVYVLHLSKLVGLFQL